jgi:hypothetical protein
MMPEPIDEWEDQYQAFQDWPPTYTHATDWEVDEWDTSDPYDIEYDVP